MRKIENNNWYISFNNLRIDLNKYSVSIEKHDEDLYILYAISKKGREYLFGFNNLEEAVVFTEDIISKYKEPRDVLEKYIEYRNLKDNDKIVLDPNKVVKVINDYYSNKYNKKVSCRYELGINNFEPSIDIYIDDNKLSNTNLEEVFEDYTNKYDCDLNCFKYVGGVHRAGYFFDNDTPYFEGIELLVNKHKNKALKKTK